MCIRDSSSSATASAKDFLERPRQAASTPGGESAAAGRSDAGACEATTPEKSGGPGGCKFFDATENLFRLRTKASDE
eukprot:9053704-Alexandrium_andersonii.AAC.1